MSRLPSKSSRITLRDIADEAGVSISTVSYVLSGKAAARRISAQVAERVENIARRQDYTPNLLVRSLQQGHTHILALHNAFGGRQSGDLYMDRLTTALEQAAGARGYDVLVQCNYSRAAEESYRFLTGGHCDGVLYFGPYNHPDLLDSLRASRIPTIVVGHADDESVLSKVLDDQKNGMKLIADALVEHGHSRIAAISGPIEWNDSTERVDFLRQNLAQHGVNLPDSNVISVADGSKADCEKSLAEFIQRVKPTAIFCWHDRIGYKCLEVCEDLGIKVPEQISIVGYDGLHWPSTSRHVLTSVKVDIEGIATSAVRLLDDLIQGRKEAPVEAMISVLLSEGTTLARAPQ